jgi:hypothetical protein
MAKVDWWGLSMNTNAIHLLEKNLDEVDWRALSTNPNAIPILEKNLNRVSCEYLLFNPNIFLDEYEIACRDYFKKYVTEELIVLMFHPNNIVKFNGWGFNEEDGINV